MARFNEILTGRFNRAAQKFLSMKGPASLPQLGSEIMAVWTYFWGVECRYLEQWERFGAQMNVGANAGNAAFFRMRNPAGSNVVAVLEKATISTNVAAAVILMDYAVSSVDLATPAIVGALDNRSGRSVASLIVSGTSASSPAAGTAVNQFVFQNANQMLDTILFEDQELTILPNTQVTFRTGAVNQQLLGGILWRERFLEESERF